ncbi:hypothetical protein BDZ85DRAFT_277532 [Elsinoe ampelina]|uniref:Uncharacterized protein n=1 Tax=Elsinoe ampelina TaxID=302913 RepID=A0A6A6GPU7_9PEZI|nr:hypothetical protein BDZ85DRAFT_277532 [Elsinoe ampelina]
MLGSLDSGRQIRWRLGMLILEILLCASQGGEAVQRTREEIHDSALETAHLGQAVRCMHIVQHYYQAIGVIPKGLSEALIDLMGVTSEDLKIDGIVDVIRKSPLCIYIRHRRTWTYAYHDDAGTNPADMRGSRKRMILASIGLGRSLMTPKHNRRDQCRLTWQARSPSQ